MSLPFASTVDRTLERLRKAFRETAAGAFEVVGIALRADLPDDDLPRLKARIDSCLTGKGGETARRGRAAELGQTYLSLSDVGRRKFLLTLAHDYGLSRETALEKIVQWQASNAPLRALRRALEPPAVRLLHEFVGVPQGVKFVVDLRAELLALGSEDAAARSLGEDLRPLLGAWFDVSFLDLVRIDWQAPAALLERLVGYEAVHAIRSWRDLKNRLDSDRRCFAFFHPRMPDEPLIFVEGVDAGTCEVAVLVAIASCGFAKLPFSTIGFGDDVDRFEAFSIVKPTDLGFLTFLVKNLDALNDFCG